MTAQAERLTVLMTIESPDHVPDLREAAKILDVPVSALDDGFGIIAVDPAKGTYTVRVFADALPEGSPWRDDGKTSGPYADVVIEPFGPPKA